MGEAVVRPRFDQDVERLEEALPAFAVRDVEAAIVAGKPAPPDAEFEPSLAEMVDRRHVLGETQRMAQREDLDRDPDFDPLRPGRDGAGDDEG